MQAFLVWLTPGWLWPRATSAWAREVDELFVVIAVIVGTWFVGTVVALLVFLYRGRQRGPRPREDLTGGRAREAWWIGAAAMLVLVSDVVIEVRSQPLWRKLVAAAPPNSLQIRVEARQFAWTVTHPGVDSILGTSDDVALQNELHVPVGQPVELHLRSHDVVHSFFLPTMRWKQDVLPGTEVRRWFVASEVGKFPVACAELCGFGHYRMGGELFVHSSDAYREWLAGAHNGGAVSGESQQR